MDRVGGCLEPRTSLTGEHLDVHELHCASLPGPDRSGEPRSRCLEAVLDGASEGKSPLLHWSISGLSAPPLGLLLRVRLLGWARNDAHP